MRTADIKTSKQVTPMIYAYTTPGYRAHDGWTKIGYTEQEVGARMKQQSHTVDVELKELWRGNALFDDGSGETFTDRDFHAYLGKNGVERKGGTEWFHIDGVGSKMYFYDFRANRGILQNLTNVTPYKLRTEQENAVKAAKNYFDNAINKEFLWNAKPRFGKTLAVYDLCKKLNAKTVLIVTNRPAIANSWYDDYVKFMGEQSGYMFVSSVGALKDKPFVVPNEEYPSALLKTGLKKKIQFVSLQDMKGSVYFGGKFDKLKELTDLYWDLLVIDEAHEGVDTFKTDVAFDKIKRKYTLHLSGTPFKALANDKFNADAIFNWTYADEQKAKESYSDPDNENPYITLPKLNMFTYKMSDIIRDEIKKGIEINGEAEDYAFDLNEFFAVNEGKFVHNASVDKFLDSLTTSVKFPFSTDELRKELKHTVWLLDRVESARRLARKLKEHPVFSEYEIVLAAGDGKIDDDETAYQRSYDKVVEKIKNHEKTITLTVGQLTTGVTIPEWTGVLMLSNVKSPALYMQTAFRAQNPCLFKEGGQFYRKENAYVFDFDPARTLTVYETIANDLYPNTTNGRGDIETRKEHIKELLNFFPVIGEDENGEMTELDAARVMSLPRKIRSTEVVKRKFMSNFLFANISCIFGAPKAALNILNKLTPAERQKANDNPVSTDGTDDIKRDDKGNVTVTPGEAADLAKEMFGKKIYDEAVDTINAAVNGIEMTESDRQNQAALERVVSAFSDACDGIMSAAKDSYGDEMTKSTQKNIAKAIKGNAQKFVDKIVKEADIKKNTARIDKQNAIDNLVFQSDEEIEKIEKEYRDKITQINSDMLSQIKDESENFVKETAANVAKIAETAKKQKKVDEVEDTVRDRLRGFTRTIPSFLMAYGDENTTLATFDKIIPDDVFTEVTSISLENFRFLRDGGDYTDEVTGETKHFEGHLFNDVVFDDSVKEFMSLRSKLADYFDENAKEDIFDYIPPQKTNQIYTPKKVVKEMVDMLEQENPGCFDDPFKTFIDLYMKSGLYIAEIVKRLYNSEKMKEWLPDDEERLRHIFENQVYGLAPTEIIYRISTNFILGFTDKIKIDRHNLRQFDALPYAKDGTLEQKLDEVFK